jgi:hypothetical protein
MKRELNLLSTILRGGDSRGRGGGGPVSWLRLRVPAPSMLAAHWDPRPPPPPGLLWICHDDPRLGATVQAEAIAVQDGAGAEVLVRAPLHHLRAPGGGVVRSTLPQARGGGADVAVAGQHRWLAGL